MIVMSLSLRDPTRILRMELHCVVHSNIVGTLQMIMIQCQYNKNNTATISIRKRLTWYLLSAIAQKIIQYLFIIHSVKFVINYHAMRACMGTSKALRN